VSSKFRVCSLMKLNRELYRSGADYRRREPIRNLIRLRECCGGNNSAEQRRRRFGGDRRCRENHVCRGNKGCGRTRHGGNKEIGRRLCLVVCLSQSLHRLGEIVVNKDSFSGSGCMMSSGSFMEVTVFVDTLLLLGLPSLTAHRAA
jgi:hypothetical protein